MLARLQKVIVALLLVVVVGWAGYFLARGPTVACVGGVFLVVAGYLGVMAIEFWLLARSYLAADGNRPRARQLVAAWCSEVVVAPRVFLWRQPFRSNALADAVGPSSRSGTRGVVLVPGFVCNRALWNPWMKKLRAADVPFIALTLEPVFGSIDAYGPCIDAAVRRLEETTGQPPLLVGHSMGGLAIRSWLRQDARLSRCQHVVTIGTPHRGTSMARHTRTTNGGQMQIGSTWLETLHANEPAETQRAFTCFWSRCDNIVVPTLNATLPGADNRELEATPHVAMVYHPNVFAEVVRLATTT